MLYIQLFFRNDNSFFGESWNINKKISLNEKIGKIKSGTFY